MRLRSLLRDRRLWVALAALLLLVRAALPLVVERVIESQASAALRMPVQLGDVDFWFVLGGIELEDLRIGRKGTSLDTATIVPEAALLVLGKAYVRVAWLDLLRGRIRLYDVEVSQPTIRVEREPDGSIAPLPEAPPEPAAPAEAEQAAAVPIAIDLLALRDAKLMVANERKGERDLLTFGLEELTLGDFALDETGISLGSVGIRRPSLRVQRELALGGPAPAAARTGATPAPPPPPASTERQAQDYSIRRIALERAEFALVMEQSELDVVLGLDAENVTLARDQTFPVRVSLEIAGGKIDLEGKTSIDPIVFDGTLRWSNLAVPPLLAPLSPGPADWLRTATCRGDLKLALRIATLTDAANTALAVSGTIALEGVDYGDPRQELAVAWKTLQVDLDESRIPLAPEAGAAKVALRALVWDEPAFRFTLPATSLAELSGGAEAAAERTPAAAEPEPPAAAPPTPSISIANLEVRAGRANFIDRSIQPEYKGELRGISVSARALRWPERDVQDLRVRWVGPDAAALDVRGALVAGTGEIRLELTKLAVPGFNPYATSLAGLEVTGGDFNLDTRVRARADKFTTKSQIVIHGLGVGSGGSSVLPGVGLPLNLVLALLRDPSGDIALSVPVDVDEGGARAGVGSIVLSALKAALVGAMSSPLKTLGSVTDLAGLTGGGATDLGIPPLEAIPGEAALSESAAGRLEQIAGLLASRPVLALVLRGRAGEPDRLPVAEDLLREAIARDEEPPLPNSSFFQRRRLRAALEERGRGAEADLSDEDRAALERWIASVQVPPELLRALATSRGDALRARLAEEHGVDPLRLPPGEPQVGEPAVTLELTAAGL